MANANAHALIIDDNAGNAKVLARLLSIQSITSTHVNDPINLDEALSHETQVDVIFLDLEMPHLNGYEVLDKLKLDARLEGVPVVACTVHTSEINTARQLGFHSFLAKPLNVDRFPDQLARILKGERVWVAV